MKGLLALVLVVASGSALAAEKDFSKFRPKTMDLDFLEKVNKIPYSKTTIEEIFDPSMTRNVEAQYKNSVGPAEKIVDSPYHFARPWEIEDYNNRKKEMAEWTTKEALNAHFSSMFHKADQESTGMQVANTFRKFTGGDDDSKQKKSSKSSSSGSATSAVVAAKNDEPTPTRIRTRMNVIKGTGNLTFQNPILTPALSLNVGKRSDEHMSIDVSKDFREISLLSKVRYGVDKKAWLLDVNKKITDEIYCNVSSLRYVGDTYAAPSGAKSDDRVSMTYTIGF